MLGAIDHVTRRSAAGDTRGRGNTLYWQRWPATTELETRVAILCKRCISCITLAALEVEMTTGEPMDDQRPTEMLPAADSSAVEATQPLVTPPRPNAPQPAIGSTLPPLALAPAVRR